MKHIIFMLIAACVLLASSCEKPKGLDGLEVQNKPQRPGDTTVVVSPGDSILPPYLEKWIWVEYTDFSGCWPITETYPPPEDLFGADARAITIDWRDSTYTSQSCKSAATFQIVPEISGRFSMRDKITILPNTTHDTIYYKVIRFSNGITMGPVEIKDWTVNPSDWYYPSLTAYAQKYLVPNQFVAIWTGQYQGTYEFQLYFLRITSQNYLHQPKKQFVTSYQKTNYNQFKYQSFKSINYGK
ncbi:MAG: hypothetical protein LBL18_02125 [Bacteroidales bacterium]|jgi:hypothetical protein|nr:hypothetical protein [Bacteroidales bacterium]